MRVISIKKLREFWSNAHQAESPLRTWYQCVKAADWTCFADVRNTYSTADLVGNKVVFDIGGNKYRLIGVIDYERHKVFIRQILDHKEYDKGQWKKDAFGEDWKPRLNQTPGERAVKTENGKRGSPTKPRKGGKHRKKK
jgi:mRNA interferase HigB